MNLKTLEDLYNRIHGNGIHLLETGRVSGDPYLVSSRGIGDNVRPDDRRCGLALLVSL